MKLALSINMAGVIFCTIRTYAHFLHNDIAGVCIMTFMLAANLGLFFFNLSRIKPC